MKALAKILVFDLPAPLSCALREQLPPPYFSVSDTESAPDLIVAASGAAAVFPGRPVLSLNCDRPLRLGPALRQIGQMLLDPVLYLDDVALGPFVFRPQEKTFAGEGGQETPLTDREVDMLAFLARHGGDSVTREDMLKNVWQYQEGLDTHTLETHIYRLRQKMGAAAFILETVPGGYRLRMDGKQCDAEA